MESITSTQSASVPRLNAQPWLGKPWVDIIFILLPPFLSLAVIALFPVFFQNTAGMPVAGWVILVLLIDVAHVYSTLYRTYFDKSSLGKQRWLLWAVPFFSMLIGVLLYTISDAFFWRLLAYVAVFHFVRQQYGFMRLYSRKDVQTQFERLVDTFTIYYATIYPLLYWHLTGPRNFNWFIDGDFYYLPSQWLLILASVVYGLMLIIYVGKEVWRIKNGSSFNWPKSGVIVGTLLSWYFGIVYFNGDMAYTLLNVVSHGVPYIALIWMHSEKRHHKQVAKSGFLKVIFGAYGLIVFIALIFLLAFIEEGLWDGAVWREHRSVFGDWHWTSKPLSDQLLSFVVPLLTVPQLTHYILDGFIWKRPKKQA